MSLKRATLLVFMLITLSSCEEAEPWPPVHPDTVPATAQLLGGIDGWQWVECHAETDKRLTCDVYDQRGARESRHYLTVCFNVHPSRFVGLEKLEPSGIHEAIFEFSRLPLYEYKPTEFFAGKSYEQGVSDKYYRLQGVTEDCQPSSPETELVVR